MPIPPPTPVETFASFIRGLTGGVAATSGRDRLSSLLIGLIVTLLREIECGLARLAARIAAGTDAPRCGSAPRRPPAAGRSRPPPRPLRSLCWTLRLDPPDILAPPAKPRPPRKTPAAPEPPPPRPPPPEPPGRPLPAWVQDRRKPWSLARIRGSPHRA